MKKLYYKKIFFIIILLLCLIFLLYYYSKIFSPIILALILAYIFTPIIDFFEKLKIKREIIIFIFTVILILIIVLILIAIIPAIFQQCKELIKFISKNFDFEKINNLTFFKKMNLKLSKDSIYEYKNYLPQFFKVGTNLINIIFIGLSNILNMFSELFIFFISFLYFLNYQKKIKIYFKKFLPLDLRAGILEYLSEVDLLLKSFLRGQSLDCLTLMILTSTGLYLLKVKFALLLGIMTGLFAFIPYLGVTMGLVSSVIITYIQYGSFKNVFYVVALFGIIQTIDGIFIAPRIIGKHVGLSPVIIILGIIILGNILGFLGVLLAVPIICVLKVSFKYLINFYKNSNIYRRQEEE